MWKISLGPGRRTGISSICSGAPNARTTAAFILLGIMALVFIQSYYHAIVRDLMVVSLMYDADH